MNTVTFGVNCAPYLAIRTLLELAKQCEPETPVVSEILRDFMYVDDVLFVNRISINEYRCDRSQLS